MTRSTRVHVPRTAGRLTAALAAVAAGAAALSGTASIGYAATAARPSFTPAPAALKTPFVPATVPQGIKDRSITVVLQVSGDPVAVQDANSAQPLTQAQQDQVRSQLKAQQNPIEDQVRAAGGTVLADYQSAYNGIKVRIAASAAAQLQSIKGVIAEYNVQTYQPDNVHGVPLIGAPQVWDGVYGLTGRGMKIADIDTGIDYTHADFAGPGTTAAYQAALSTDTQPANPSLFGPSAPRVKGGIDLVGDSYDATPTDAGYQPIPHPDPNPLDCNGHGTHTAGTAAGSGVLENGSTFQGPYNATTVSSHSWLVGPGVAPEADIYSVRVFGCNGSTNVVVDAIDWAVKNHMDVINMSLGSPFGSADAPDAVASTNAAKDGVIVVASAGNSGSAPYIVGDPSSATGAISVAASDPTASFPAANVALTPGGTIQAIDANGAPLPSGPLHVKVLRDSQGNVSLGCNPAEYTAGTGVAGDLVVVRRGTCARVARAIFGQQASAAAVLMINSSNAFPPYEGRITSNPDTGAPYNVTIPFLGVPSASKNALLAADGGTATLSATTLANPGYLQPASFSSGGPRPGDSALKPDVTAPGVSIASAGMGTGTDAVVESGTSMAAPHTTGAAALVRQAHPSWGSVKYWKAALVNTADPALVNGYSTVIAGAGLIQVPPAVATQAVALAQDGTASLSFGYAELSNDYRKDADITIHNFGSQPATFAVSTTLDAGVPHGVTFDHSQVTVNAHGDGHVHVTLNVPASTAGDTTAFNSASGLVRLTPLNGANNGVRLDVPYYFVPRALSNIKTELDKGALTHNLTATATVTNAHGAGVGRADWYAWGLTGGGSHVLPQAEIRNVGVQSLPSAGVLAFAIATKGTWSNPAVNEFDVLVDVNGDGKPDYDVVGVDLGTVTAGSASGQLASVVVTLATGNATIDYLADAPFNSNTLVLPVDFPQLCDTGAPCLSASSPRFSYTAVSFDPLGASDALTSSARFNAFNPSITTGMYDVLQPGQTATETVAINATEWAITPAKGLMIVSHDNSSGDKQAQLIDLPQRLH